LPHALRRRLLGVRDRRRARPQRRDGEDARLPRPRRPPRRDRRRRQRLERFAAPPRRLATRSSTPTGFINTARAPAPLSAELAPLRPLARAPTVRGVAGAAGDPRRRAKSAPFMSSAPTSMTMVSGGSPATAKRRSTTESKTKTRLPASRASRSRRSERTERP